MQCEPPPPPVCVGFGSDPGPNNNRRRGKQLTSVLCLRAGRFWMLLVNGGVKQGYGSYRGLLDIECVYWLGHALEANFTPTGGGGGAEAKPDLCVPQINLQISGPFDKFHFFPEDKFSYVGGRVGQGAQAAIPPLLPGNPGNGKPWPAIGLTCVVLIPPPPAPNETPRPRACPSRLAVWALAVPCGPLCAETSWRTTGCSWSVAGKWRPLEATRSGRSPLLPP